MEILKSSQDPNKQSLTISGLIILLVPFLIQVLQGKGIEIAESDIMQLVETVTALLGAIAATYGAGRKVWNGIISKKK